MGWDDLRFFLAVAREGTVTAAARQLAVDPATVMRRVDALEADLDVTLFERDTRGYTLTIIGEKLLQPARAIEAEMNQVRTELGRSAEISGTVRISALEGFGNFFLASHLPHFRLLHPRLRVELLTIQQIQPLSRRDADISIMVNPPGVPGFDRFPLTSYSLFVYGTADYLRKNPVRSRADLSDHVFYGYIDDLIFSRGLDYLGEVVPQLRSSLQSSSLHAQMAFACEGFGLCVLPAFIAKQRPELKPVLPEEVKLDRVYWAVTAQPRDTTPATRAALRFVQDIIKEKKALFTSWK